MIEGIIACLVDKSLCTLQFKKFAFLQNWQLLIQGKKMKDGLKGSVSDRSLDAKIERYKSSMAALDEQVNYLHMSTTVTVKASVSDMTPKVTIPKA